MNQRFRLLVLIFFYLIMKEKEIWYLFVYVHGNFIVYYWQIYKLYFQKQNKSELFLNFIFLNKKIFSMVSSNSLLRSLKNKNGFPLFCRTSIKTFSISVQLLWITNGKGSDPSAWGIILIALKGHIDLYYLSFYFIE